ncbi:hypothetical protein [Nonomuraea sp. NPDC050643]|uniref:hypothetical protein n=1 Tax=Nonomuraea sp. NPDC050643 TaxID=3155660 RepID=UPI003411307F
MPDLYPGDLLQEIRELKQRVADLEAIVRAQPGRTTASQGWILPSLAAPDTSALPAGALQLYGRGSLVRYRPAGNGTEVTLTATPTAGHVASILLGTAGASYTALEQNILNTVVSTVNSILAELQAVDLMA